MTTMPNPHLSAFAMIEDALNAMRDIDDYAMRRMQHTAILRLLEQTLRDAADRLAVLRRRAA